MAVPFVFLVLLSKFETFCPSLFLKLWFIFIHVRLSGMIDVKCGLITINSNLFSRTLTIDLWSPKIFLCLERVRNINFSLHIQKYQNSFKLFSFEWAMWTKVQRSFRSSKIFLANNVTREKKGFSVNSKNWSLRNSRWVEIIISAVISQL